MPTLPAEIQEQIVSYLPFVNIIPLRRVCCLWNEIILHLLSRINSNYLSSWTMALSTANGTTVSIPLSLESTRDADNWTEIYHRPYIFTGPVSGIFRTDQAQVLKLQFWDTKQGQYIPRTNPECVSKCCGLCDITIWPWSTLPVSRQGPLGEVIKWRDLYKIDLWESHWDKEFIQHKSRQQQIGMQWHTHGMPIMAANHGVHYMSMFSGQPVQVTNEGHVAVPGLPGTSFLPNRIRIALSYSAICGFLLLQKRMEAFQTGDMGLESLNWIIKDPRGSEPAIRAKLGCGCKLADWEHEDLGIKVIQLDDSESNNYDRFR